MWSRCWNRLQHAVRTLLARLSLRSQRELPTARESVHVGKDNVGSPGCNLQSATLGCNCRKSDGTTNWGTTNWGTINLSVLALSVPVRLTLNQAKGDKSPDMRKPPLTSFYCIYSRSWAAVKYAYGLSVTSAEKSALSNLLNTW
ncbi:hypothetical protein VTK56DRAFT_6932 [Thermocarpiscus australiensis]